MQEPENQVLQIFSLKHIDADNDLVMKLSTVLKVLVAVDKRTNSIIIQASPEQIDRVKALIQALDVPAPAIVRDPLENDRQVRIVWLMSGLKEGGAVPQDLKAITDELGRYGVVGLQLMTQTIVRGARTVHHDGVSGSRRPAGPSGDPGDVLAGRPCRGQLEDADQPEREHDQERGGGDHADQPRHDHRKEDLEGVARSARDDGRGSVRASRGSLHDSREEDDLRLHRAGDTDAVRPAAAPSWTDSGFTAAPNRCM